MLNMKDFKRISEAALAVVEERGAGYYGWVNAPVVEGEKISHTSGWGENVETREITPKEAMEIMSKKLDGAYGERFIMSLGTISALIRNGYSVRFVQFAKEEGTPFDASGWTVIVVETMPIFHINPDDLRAEDISDLVEILPNNEAPDVSWKGTDKLGEFRALLAGSEKPGLNLVEIAQKYSK